MILNRRFTQMDADLLRGQRAKRKATISDED